MLVNKNPCFVDIVRRPGCCVWDIYFVQQTPDGKLCVAQPTDIVYKLQDEGAEIKPCFSYNMNIQPNLENWCVAIIETIFKTFPHIREKYQTVKRNEDEIRAMDFHIQNLNDIIRWFHPQQQEKRLEKQ